MNLIITGLDNNPAYIEQAKCMLASLAQTNPEQPVRVYCANWNGEALRGFNSNAEIVPCDYRDPTTCDIRIAMVRFDIVAALHAINLPGLDKLAWLDCDTLIRGDLSGLWDAAGPDEFAALYRPNQPPRMRLNAGVWLLGNGRGARSFVQRWHKNSLAHDSWWSEQQAAWTTVQAFPHVVKFRILSRRFNDLTMRPDGIIWHPRGIGLEAPQFVRARDMILERAAQKGAPDHAA